MRVRSANAADAAVCAAIYNQYVVSGGATLDSVPVEPDFFVECVGDPSQSLIVAAQGPTVLGFGRLFPWSRKPGYSKTAETSVYVAPGSLGRGIGAAIKQALIVDARTRQLHHLVARVFASNTANVKMNHRFGYRLVGVQHDIGWSQGEFVDICVFELVLASPSSAAQ